MRMRVLTTKLRVEIENEMRVFLESLNFEIEMRVSQKSAVRCPVKRMDPMLITKTTCLKQIRIMSIPVLF